MSARQPANVLIPGPSGSMRPAGEGVPRSPVPVLRGGSNRTPNSVPFMPPRPDRTIEEHFYMTNEHLDVVGKTTWDAVDMHTKQQISTTNTKHDQLLAMFDKYVEGLQSEISLINKKVDEGVSQTQSVVSKLDQLEKFLKTEVIGAMTEQMKKTVEVESNIKETQKAMVHMQLTVDKLSESKSTSTHPATGMMPHTTPVHQSQPALATYYGTEASRDEQSSGPTLPDRSVSGNYDAHGDARGNYSNNWHSQGWTGRSAYHGRYRGEASPYGNSNPYNLGNSGQYNTGYINGYPPYNHSPATSEQPYTYGQKHAQ
jgi:hypothetical protein